MSVITFAPKKSWHSEPITVPASKYPLVCSIMLRGAFVDFPARLTPKTLTLVSLPGSLTFGPHVNSTYAKKHTFHLECGHYTDRLSSRGITPLVVSVIGEKLGPNTSPELRTLLEGIGEARAKEVERNGLISAAKVRVLALERLATSAAQDLLNAITLGEGDLEALAAEYRKHILEAAAIGTFNEDVGAETAAVWLGALTAYKKS